MTTAKQISIVKDEMWESLLDELRSAITTFRDEESIRRIEMKHTIGEIIVTSVYYKKHGRQNLLLVNQIATALDMSATNIRYCVQFYEKHPKLSPLVETLRADKSRLTWTDIKESLAGPKDETETDNKCHHVWKCQMCGLIK